VRYHLKPGPAPGFFHGKPALAAAGRQSCEVPSDSAGNPLPGVLNPGFTGTSAWTCTILSA